jgi:hypothetical protein
VYLVIINLYIRHDCHLVARCGIIKVTVLSRIINQYIINASYDVSISDDFIKFIPYRTLYPSIDCIVQKVCDRVVNICKHAVGVSISKHNKSNVETDGVQVISVGVDLAVCILQDICHSYCFLEQKTMASQDIV